MVKDGVAHIYLPMEVICPPCVSFYILLETVIFNKLISPLLTAHSKKRYSSNLTFSKFKHDTKADHHPIFII